MSNDIDFIFFKENEIHQRLIKQGAKPKSLDHTRSREALRSATNVCLSILKSRVQFAKMDQVYYFLGYNSEESGNRRDAQKYFQTVVQRYPSSAFAPEAYRNLAEYAFDQKDFRKALSYYEQAARYKNIPSYPRTLYKLAWAYFKNRRKSEALSTMKKVIEITSGEDKYVGLKEEALGDLVMIFSEAGRFQEAKDYFAQISGGPEFYVKALSRLASLYERRGDSQLAIRVNDNLIQEYADEHPELIFDVLGKNVELYKKLGDFQGESAALTKLVQFYAKNKDVARRNEDSLQTYVRTKNYLKSRATDLHKQARKEKKESLYVKASELYALYLRAFLSDPANDAERKEQVEVKTYRIDCLLAAQNEKAAIPELEAVMDLDGEQKLSRESGTTLLNILIKKLDQQKSAKGQTSELESYFFKVSEKFESRFAGDKLIPELRYKKARLLAARSGSEGMSSDAKDALEELIEKFPSREEAADAARELVADLVKRNKLDDASELSNKYLANSTLIHAGNKISLAQYLRSVIAHESFSDVQKIEKDNDFSRAAAEYERLSKQSTSDAEVAYKSLNNAAVNYEKAGDTQNAMRVYLEISSKFPKQKSPKEDIKRLAATTLYQGDFDGAAKVYAQLASSSIFNEDEKLNFMRTSFLMAVGIKDYSNAATVGQRLLGQLCANRKRGMDERCHDQYLGIAKALIDSGKYDASAQAYRAYTEMPSARLASGYYGLARVYSNLKESSKERKLYEQIAALPKSHRSNAVERNIIAHASFILSEDYFTRFMNLKLELPESRLKAVTRQKLSMLEDLVQRLSNIVAIGDGEWGIAALERIHDAFYSFSDELLSAPMPQGLSPEGKAAYERGIRQAADPMKVRAVEFLKQGYKKGLELSVATPTFIALTQRLAKREPRNHPPAHYSISEKDRTQSKLKLIGSNLEQPEISRRLKTNPKDTQAWVDFGNIEAASGRFTLARFMYDQALALHSNDPAALNNRAVISFFEGNSIEAVHELAKAQRVAELNKDVRLNQAKLLSAYHHFQTVLESLKALSARFANDEEVQILYGAALLGTGNVPAARAKFATMNASSSNAFSLWYNETVARLFSSNADDRKDALEKLKDEKSSVDGLERAQIDTAIAIGMGRTNE